MCVSRALTSADGCGFPLIPGAGRGQGEHCLAGQASACEAAHLPDGGDRCITHSACRSAAGRLRSWLGSPGPGVGRQLCREGRPCLLFFPPPRPPPSPGPDFCCPSACALPPKTASCEGWQRGSCPDYSPFFKAWGAAGRWASAPGRANLEGHLVGGPFHVSHPDPPQQRALSRCLLGCCCKCSNAFLSFFYIKILFLLNTR